MEDNLSTIHRALADSVFDKSKPGSPTSFRLEQELKDIVNEICENNGTKLSAFLRQCCLKLAKDYRSSQHTEE